MPPSSHVTVHVNLDHIRDNVQQIRQRIGGTELHAVVKADAYGLGARHVADAVGDLVDGFVVFYASEAVEAALPAHGKPVLALGPPQADLCLRHGIRPSVWTVRDAEELRAARPVLAVDTGMQRFACAPEQVGAVLAAGDCREAFTHGTSVHAARRLVELVGGRGLRLHAAGSALLEEPEAWLDLVRPGLALYRGAVTVSSRLVEVHDSNGPIGYTGFRARRHGVILAGYSNGLRPGPCLVGGKRRRIPEVGMQSAFVELEAGDDVDAEVTLLGGSPEGTAAVSEDDVAAAWRCTPHEALLQLARSGRQEYI